MVRRRTERRAVLQSALHAVAARLKHRATSGAAADRLGRASIASKESGAAAGWVDWGVTEIASGARGRCGVSS